MEVLEEKEEQINYHNSHKGVFAIRIRKLNQRLFADKERIKVINGILSSFNHEKNKQANFEFKENKEQELEIEKMKKKFKPSKELKKAFYIKVKPNFNSFLASQWLLRPAENI